MAVDIEVVTYAITSDRNGRNMKEDELPYETTITSDSSNTEINRYNYSDVLSSLYIDIYKTIGEADSVKLKLKDGETPRRKQNEDWYEANGQNGNSGWIIRKYLKLYIDLYSVNSVRGSSCIPTPIKYSNPTCGLISIRNEDNECFRWCMLFHQSKQEKIVKE